MAEHARNRGRLRFQVTDWRVLLNKEGGSRDNYVAAPCLQPAHAVFRHPLYGDKPPYASEWFRVWSFAGSKTSGANLRSGYADTIAGRSFYGGCPRPATGLYPPSSLAYLALQPVLIYRFLRKFSVKTARFCLHALRKHRKTPNLRLKTDPQGAPFPWPFFTGIQRQVSPASRLASRWLSPSRIGSPANRFGCVFCPATRPYAPLFSKIFRKGRPILS
jgi:hypothetical protein